MGLFYQTIKRVEFRDTDAAGIVHYTSFFNWMEQSEHEFLRRLDWSVVRKEEEFHLSWPRASVGCEFSKPLKFQQVFGLQVHLQSVGNSSVRYGFEFLHPADLNQLWPQGYSGGIAAARELDPWKASLPSADVGRQEDSSFRLSDQGWISPISWFDQNVRPAASGNITTVCCEIVPGKPPKSTPIPSLLRERLLPFVRKETTA